MQNKHQFYFIIYVIIFIMWCDVLMWCVMWYVMWCVICDMWCVRCDVMVVPCYVEEQKCDIWHSMLDFECLWLFHPVDKTNHLTQKCNKHKLSSAVVSNFSFWLRAGGFSREQRFMQGSYHSACCVLCNIDVCLCCVLLLVCSYLSENVLTSKVLSRRLNKQTIWLCWCAIIHLGQKSEV